jgi:thymidylate synthase ThyX
MAGEAPGRRVYLLSARNLSPETIAVAFAKTSRSPLAFDEIAAELSEEQSAAFHEKWVVGYGHASVAEHAVLHIAFENVSRLAIECIESNRLASYTEKSTRYQHWSHDSVHVPQEIRGTALEASYQDANRKLMQVYLQSLDSVRQVVRRRNPRRLDETESQWDARLRSRYVDVCRFLLPAAVLANVGMTVNARSLESALRKMLGHPLAEVRAIGEEARIVCRAEAPTLLKYADPTPYPAEMHRTLAAFRQPSSGPAGAWLTLVSHDKDGESRVLAASLYSGGQAAFGGASAEASGWTQPERARLAEALLGGRGAHDPAPRALELAQLAVEVQTDQGAYFELKRHRMMTQLPQRLGARHGFAVPLLLAEAGVEADYRRAMEAAAAAFEQVEAWNPEVASYLVPNGYYRRVLLSMNLRQAFHFCELRAAPNAHFSIRWMALRLAEEIRKVYPLLGAYLRTPPVTADELWQEHFGQDGLPLSGL